MLPWLYKYYTTRCVSPFLLDVYFMSEWIFVVFNCHLCNPVVIVNRKDMILKAEALSHSRSLSKSSTLSDEYVNFQAFFALSFPTEQFA